MKTAKSFLTMTVCAALILLLNNCRDTSGIEPDVNLSRIVPGVSIDGVNLGDYPEVVELKIGPSQYHGSGEGPKAHLIDSYVEGAHKGLSVWYISGYVADTLVHGPADYLMIDTTFEGKTKEGLGPGSTPASVLAAWGIPPVSDSTRLPYWFRYTYYFQGKQFTVTFKNGKAVGFLLGPFVEGP